MTNLTEHEIRELGKWQMLLEILTKKGVITEDEGIAISLARFDENAR